jgi:hypothetical protein
VRLETLGRPTAVIVTSAFRHEALMQRDALGMPDLLPVVIDHPLSTLTDAEIDSRADAAVGPCIAVWRGN